MTQHEHGTPAGAAQKTALISGASFAGLATAWWMHRLGYRVTLVEVAPGLRLGGTPVDIREGVVDVVRRMGLLDGIAVGSLPPRPTEFLRPDGTPLLQRPPSAAAEDDPDAPGPDGQQAQEWEIERDTLLHLLFSRVHNDVEFLFSNSIASVEETPDEVTVTFATGERRSFSLLLGCDGTHSAVRRLCFGPESSYLLYLRNYFSLTIVPRLLIPENTAQMYSLPGKTVMLNAYNGKTDIAFAFFAPEELPYERRDREAQKRMIRDRFTAQGWRIPELLDEMTRAGDFYFDKLCQIRMPRWCRGRVALVGDAGYCPSPAAGMGGSMALLGAAALADAFQSHPDNLQQAFEDYDRRLRPVAEQIQANAIEFGLKMFLPASEEELQARNSALHLE